MKIGGQIIYAEPLGHQSHKLVEYFQVSLLYQFILSNISHSFRFEVKVFLKVTSCRLFQEFQGSGMVIIMLHGFWR